jgi:hypothetical protein
LILRIGNIFAYLHFFAHFVENKSLPLRLKQGVLPLQCIAAAAPFAAERPVRGWFRDFELF